MTRTPAPLPLEDRGLPPPVRPFADAPRGAYTDPDVLAWEQINLFDGSWVCAGRTTDLAAPRSQRAVRIGTTGVLLTRDDAGALHAFANICRHRGHELLAVARRRSGASCNAPTTPELRARRGAPPRTALRGRPQLRAGRHGPAAVAACRVGWMGLRQHRWPGRPVRGPPRCLRSVDRGWQCERLVVAASHEYDLQANWKIALENYHECYHCPLIHPELCEVSHSDSGTTSRRSTAWSAGTWTSVTTPRP